MPTYIHKYIHRLCECIGYIRWMHTVCRLQVATGLVGVSRACVWVLEKNGHTLAGQRHQARAYALFGPSLWPLTAPLGSRTGAYCGCDSTANSAGFGAS